MEKEVGINLYCVYKHTAPNGKVYIGITGQTPKLRWKNGYGYANNDYFFRAIKKYGWDNFKHEILIENITQKEACEKEIEFIAEYKSNNPKYGYNISSGGEKTTLGLKLSNEARHNMSKSHKGKVQAKETILKRVKHYSGTNHWLYGKHWDEKAKSKMRDAKLGKKQTKEHIKNASATRYKAVYCIEKQKVYNSFLEAANELDICKSSISEVANGKRKTAGGYHFVFYDKDKPRTEVYIEKLSRERG